MTTVYTELKWAVNCLQDHENAVLEAQILLAYILECDRLKLITWPEMRVASDQSMHYHRLVERRAQHEPIAYLVGEKEFWSRIFVVTRDTLIPRPETEKLIEVALARLPETALTVLDVGTGSGIIACTLALERPAWQVVGLDCSDNAIEIAKINAERLGAKNVTWMQSDWLSAWQGPAVDVIVSNPPYLRADDEHLTQDLLFEPHQALVAGQTGLEAYEILIPQAASYLKKQGVLLLEHGYDQANEVQKLLQKSGFGEIQTYPDLSGQGRVTVGLTKLNISTKGGLVR